jgi:hypothetical protein
MIHLFNPESTLESAKELIKQNRSIEALEIILDFTKKTKKRQWSIILEELMSISLEECVKNRNNEILRNIFTFYYYASQYDNLENVGNMLTNAKSLLEQIEITLILTNNIITIGDKK